MSLNNPIPPDVERIYAAWQRYRRIWWFYHYLIGVGGLVAAITVANKPAFLQQEPAILSALAWLSALCVALLTFLEPRKRARAYAAAWRLLHKEIGKYRHGPPDQNPATLFDAIAQGEEFIARLDG